MRISEQFISIPVLTPLDTQAGVDGQSVNMGLLHSICFPIAFGAITGDAVLKFYVGATDGTKTTAVAFKYRLSSGAYKAASADLYGAVTDVASTGLTLTAATFTTKAILIEFDSQAIADATPWLTLELSAAADVLLVSCVAVGVPRHLSNAGTTVV
jgi:hypothetical protein